MGKRQETKIKYVDFKCASQTIKVNLLNISDYVGQHTK
jgi:hypothetical protein